MKCENCGEEIQEDFRSEYEAEQKERENNPDKYPFFAYFQFGFHRMSYMTKEEVEDAVKFYHLKSNCEGGYFRPGRQPIDILPRR